MTIELRFQTSELNIIDDGALNVTGYVNKTNQPSEILGGRQRFIEIIKPGAFKKALENREKDIDFLAEHDTKKILSSTRNNSLYLTEDKEGLYMEATITPTSWGKDTHTLIRSGILRNMSFGFKVLKDSWKRVENNLLERTIEQLQLFEVSVVKDPAYSQSTIEARGIDVLQEVEIPYELDEEKQMEKVITLIEGLSEKLDGAISEITELRNLYQNDVEVREKNKEEEPTPEPEKVPEEVPAPEEVELEEVQPETEPEKTEEKPEVIPEPEVVTPVEPEPEARSLEIGKEHDALLSKLNKLKLEENQ